ncbi:MAG: sulfite exporter TauE/SafE family protein [Chloroflexia bacterium]|nr:sulfite exporter TauE/SafE family protein [Chloroflexia bacterium]
MDQQYVAAALIVFVARLLSGVTGFGFALVVVPTLMLVYEPARVVAAAVLLALGTGWILLLGTTHHVQMRTVLGLLPGAAVGSLLGTVLLASLDADLIQAIASVAVVLFGIGHAAGWAPATATGAGATAFAGLASGALNTSVGMAGPPVVMLLTARQTPMHAFRATVIAYFIGVSALGAAMLVAGGLVDGDVVRLVAALLPPTLLGLAASRWLVRRVSQAAFRRLTLGLLLATGIVGAAQALHAILR